MRMLQQRGLAFCTCVCWDAGSRCQWCLVPAGGSNGKSIAVVGKGLTFDSGGYNIKAGPGSLIEMMKFDMVRAPGAVFQVFN